MDGEEGARQRQKSPCTVTLRTALNRLFVFQTLLILFATDDARSLRPEAVRRLGSLGGRLVKISSPLSLSLAFAHFKRYMCSSRLFVVIADFVYVCLLVFF